MVLGRFRVAFYAKCLLAFIWTAYFLIFNTEFRSFLPTGQAQDFKLKSCFRKECEVALLGGSNVSVGLSAEVISGTFQCLNLGLFSEYGSFKNYSNWLSKGVFAKIVVYSPICIWNNFDAINLKEQSCKIELPPTIISQIYLWYRLVKRKDSFFNKFGDANESYGSGVVDYYIDSLKFQKSNRQIVSQLILKINELKKITRAEYVYIRIPPIYNSSLFAKSLHSLINERIALLNNAGVKTLSTTTVSGDISLFQDNFHASKKGREVFTKELLESLMSGKYIY